MNLIANDLKMTRLQDLPTHPDDWFLAQQCVAGDLGAQRQLRAVLDSFVKGCLRNRGASYTEAEDIVADIASEIPADREEDFCLLRKYKGKCLLKNWLSRVAINRWIDLKRREIFVIQLPTGKGGDSPSPIERIPSQEAGVPEDFLLNLLRTCLQPAFEACPAEQLLMLRLVYLENLSQSEAGMMWGWHRSKVNRALRATMRGIESRTLLRLSLIDPWLAVSWDDFLNMYAVSMIRHESDQPPNRVKEIIARFARGTTAPAERLKLCETLQERPEWVPLLATEVKSLRGSGVAADAT